MFTVNIHPVERVIRALVGLGVLSLVFVGPKSLWGLLGLVPLLTALVGWCPPYALLGISTCRRKGA
ncbi:MAG: YgaP family membrane protein [Acidobacteriota bacterium]